MASSTATSVTEYLGTLPPERRAVVAAVRDLVRRHLPEGYQEGMNWGMISWEIPLSRYPETYNRQPLLYAALAAQKGGYSLYLTGAWMVPGAVDRLKASFEAAGRRLDMGKSCLRFRKLEELPLDAVAEVIAAIPVDTYIAAYEAVKPPRRG